jgi:hypothetical protein
MEWRKEADVKRSEQERKVLERGNEGLEAKREQREGKNVSW